ncbi:hypothetical protein Athai_15520 [Actinocatenispora thailandica]|uniref:Lipoprotein n=1 Tax=Actinocatenispora thailandica TaxID=227318 RepID=A0A7R7DLR8_9ACTN|nr:hypothetical protein [Actinocatenispora thailandica]BCJ34049.1 hypothetical protein Athai_15520 [Actinocatenispora thailandica]
MAAYRPRRRLAGAGMAIALVLTLAGCAGAAGPNNVASVATGHTAGFWAGLWQGLILPITFVVSLFTSEVSIYDVHNNGNWYDFGYVLGIFLPVVVFRPRRRSRKARAARSTRSGTD